jgi:hypothetical protein
LEILKDFAVLEEMVIEVAKWAYLKDHPDRKRSPRGFTSGLSLKITSVDEGSAIPVIALFAATASLFPEQNQIYFERARDHIVRAIDAAAHSESITPHLPESLLGYFDRVGRSLHDNEWIDFDPANADRPARLTKATRRRLILASGDVQELTEEVALRGAIPEADQDTMSFTLQVINGARVRATVESQHLQTVIDAFNGYRTGTRVILHGVARFNRYNRLQSIESVEHVSLLDPNDIAARLDEFRSLKPGWFDGEGLSPVPEGLDWLNRAFEAHYPDDLPLPYLYPTVEGNVRAEWSLPPYEVSLDILIVDRGGVWHSLNLDDDREMVKDLDLEDRADWDWLSKNLRELMAEEAV